MSRALTVELSDEVFDALSQQAETVGVPPAQLLADDAVRWYGTRPRSSDPDEARARFERHFGSVDLGRPTGLDNERIDADLAREYGRGLD